MVVGVLIFPGDIAAMTATADEEDAKGEGDQKDYGYHDCCCDGSRSRSTMVRRFDGVASVVWVVVGRVGSMIRGHCNRWLGA